ncbi:MAG: T9SS type A sorting domain-containing protein [Paludibacteraceae bacterium]|nr:T9SS type A sorting domain-containing protein [Paludibacteraceae bacterium]
MLKKRILYLLLFGLQSVMFGQNATTSLNINVSNVRLSTNAKTLSFDVYLQRINPDTVVAIPGFLIRLAIPQADLGTNTKRITVTNTTRELGVRGEAITESGSDWLLQFLSGNLILSYSTALAVSTKSPGTRVGTVNVMNEDGSAFADPLTFTLEYPGSAIKTKATCSVFKPNQIVLATNSTKAQPEANFIGLGTYKVAAASADTIANFSFYPNPANNSFYINIGNKSEEVNIFDMKGNKVLSQLATGSTTIDISAFANGVYMVEVNGIQNKLIKK